MRVILTYFGVIFLLQLSLNAQIDENIPSLFSQEFIKLGEQEVKDFENLLHEMEFSELLDLFDNKNDITRGYAFWGLAIKNYPELFNLLIKNLRDNHFVTLKFYDMQDEMAVSDFYIKVVNGSIDGHVRISNQQNKTLDSILLYNDDIDLYAKTKILIYYQPIAYQYTKIKELAKTGYSPFAIVALAKFRNEQDLSCIDSLLNVDDKNYYALLAIREFPHEKFYSILQNELDEMIKAKKINYSKLRALYQALAQYPTEQTVNQFNMAIKKTRGFKGKTHEKYIWLAIDKYPNPIFNKIKQNIKLTEFELNDLEGERKF